MNCPSCQQALHEDADFCSNCGLSTARFHTKTKIIDPQETIEYAHPPDPLIGRVLDSKYELIEALGAGGMGAVYRARRLHIGDEVAVKVLHPNLVFEAQAVERFRREARSAAMISHPNVVSIHDFSDAGVAGAPAYIVMELVLGTSLRNLLKREGRLSPELAVALMHDVCAGVGIAHRQGLLHRDLKPDNVIITPANHEGERESAKVVDFGLAKLRDAAEGATLTQTGAVIGTLYYMSPEQCSGEELDARSDVYSLGAMLFEMLTGEPPFRASNLRGLIAKHLNEPPPTFPEALQIPPALAVACYRALAKNRDERQADALALDRELQTLAPSADAPGFTSDAKTLRARPTPLTVPLKPTSSRLKWTIGGLAALLVIVTVIGAAIAIKYVAAHIGQASANSNNTGSQNTQTRSDNGALPAEKSDAERSSSESVATNSSVRDLTGTWPGTYGPLNQPAKLIIRNHQGKKFDGVLEQGEVRVAFSGTLDAASREVTIKESEVLSGSGWSLGEDVGKLSADGRKMSGTGRDAVGGQFGMSYEWSFSRP
jgi:serine/threonine protein kinase